MNNDDVMSRKKVNRNKQISNGVKKNIHRCFVRMKVKYQIEN